MECKYSEEDMYSAIMPIRDVPNAGKAVFSLQGIVDRVFKMLYEVTLWYN